VRFNKSNKDTSLW